MAFHCPHCQLPLTENEKSLGTCPVCHKSLAQDAPPRPDAVVHRAGPGGQRGWGGGQFFVVILGLLLLGALILAPRIFPPAAEKPDRTDLDKIEHGVKTLDRKLERLAVATKKVDELALNFAGLEKKLDELAAKMLGLDKQSQELRSQLAKLEGGQAALAQRSFAPPAPPGPLEIRVLPGDWSDASPENLQAVCLSAAKELWQHFPDRRLELITVRHSKQGPMVTFGRGPDGERRVLLHVNGKFWAQCGYQFAHEFCHILVNCRAVPNPHHWFEEALCETASMFALRKMADTWTMHPPYPNWRSFAPALSDYADNLIRTTPPLEGLTVAQWFARNEKLLQANGTDRPRCRVVALKLLKLLETGPHHWQAVGYLNQWEPKGEFPFASYLADWHHRVPHIHKPFVEDVGKLFDIKL